MFLKFRIIDGEYIVQISRGVAKHVYKVILFRFVKVRHKIPLITKIKKSATSWAVVTQQYDDLYKNNSKLKAKQEAGHSNLEIKSKHSSTEGEWNFLFQPVKLLRSYHEYR